MQKMIMFIVTMLMCAGSTFAAEWIGSETEPESTRKIDDKVFYVITSADELAWFAAKVNSGETNINAILGNDIVFGSNQDRICEKEFSPIGNASTVFNGIFDGGNHTIYGINVNLVYEKNDGSAGIVGVAGKNAIIRNVKTKSGMIAGVVAGGIVGENSGTIENVENGNSVGKQKEGDEIIVRRDYLAYYAGGIAGKNKGTIVNSKNTGGSKIKISYSHPGGTGPGKGNTVIIKDSLFVGGGVGLNEGTIKNFSSTTLISVEAWANGLPSMGYGTYEMRVDVYLGGVAGKNSSTGVISVSSFEATSNFSFTDYLIFCHLENEKSYVNCFKGGLVARNDGKVNNTYTTKGPLVNVNKGSIKNSYSHEETSYWQNNTQVTYSAENMKKDQFAWILNTTNGTTSNSKVWSRADGFPIFATSTYKPIFKVFFDDNGSTTSKYSTNKGTVSFPTNSTPSGYIFDGWYNSSNVKVSSSTEFSSDQTVTSKYIDPSVKYTIKFYDSDSTTVLGTQTVGYGVTPSYSGSTPTKASTAQYSYTFSKWTPTLVAANSNANYYATYTSTERSYTITFNDYNGTKLQSISVKYGTTPSYSLTPTRASTAEWEYTFKGWNPSLTAVTGAATYMAVYDSSIAKYKVEFVDYNGSLIQSKMLEYGTTPITPSSPTRSATAQWTYTFKNWSPTIASVTKAATYKAIYDSTKRSYTIVFVDYDGKQLQSSSELYGSIPSYASTPSRSSTEKWNYTFKGWNPSVASVTGDVSYKAKYDSSKVLYAISMINDDGFIETEYKEYGSTFVIPKGPSKDGYSFVGWYKGDDFFGNVGDVVSITENVSIEAKYLINSYKITFVDFDGKTLKQELYEYGKIPSYGTLLSRQATEAFVYEFVGWSPTISNVTRNAVYIAKYDSTKVKYTVVFMNGVEEFDSQDVEYGASAKYPASTPRKTGFRFVGWNKDFSNVTTDLIVEAMFEEITSSSSMVPGNSSESGNSGEENKESILARPNSHFSVNTISHSIQISGAIVGSRLSLLDMQGRVLKQEYVNSSNFVISVQHSGSYILRVGNHSLRVVIK